MHHRGVVLAAEFLTDLGQREVGELSAQVHGDLSCRHQGLSARGPFEIVGCDPEIVRGLVDDRQSADLGVRPNGDQVTQDHLGQVQVDFLAVEGREGGDPDQGTFQFADVGLNAGRDELQDLRRNQQLLGDGLALQDRLAGLQVGRLHVGDQAPLETAAQPGFQGLQCFRGPVRGHHNLLLSVVQRVEGVKELLLRLDLRLQKLDVVDQQHVHVAIAAPEGNRAVLGDRVDEVVGQFLGADVLHLGIVEVLAHVMPDGMQEMRLSQPRIAVDHQGVVRLAGVLGDGGRCGVREAVRTADDEVVEGVLRIQPHPVGTVTTDESRRVDAGLGQQMGLGRDHHRGIAAANQLVGLKLFHNGRVGGAQIELKVGLHGDHQLHGSVEGIRQRIFDFAALVGLDPAAGVVAGHRDEHDRLVHGHRLGRLQPSPGRGVGLGQHLLPSIRKCVRGHLVRLVRHLTNSLSLPLPR